MMASPSDVSSEYNNPHISSMILKFDETQKIEEFLARLEQEWLKIEAFKRELPLCMQLLANAMEASKQQLQSQRAMPVLEEFMPLKRASDSSEMASNEEKTNWMTSAQLWNQEGQGVKPPPSPLVSSPREPEIKLCLNGKQRISGGGAFHPFSSRDPASSSEVDVFPELALSSAHAEELEERKSSPETKNSGKCGGFSGGEREQVGSGVGSTSQRKARRCWSPDLHRRFVHALHMLGGSQVATPKQIRELMKVDGLTNDEVKSHLQKYRLHTRRPSPSPQAAVGAQPQVVVLGGIWVPQEYAAAAAQGGSTAVAALYGAHAAAAHHLSPPFCSPAPPMPQEMYQSIAAAPPPSNHHLHRHHATHHPQLRAYNKPPPPAQRNSSPESDVQGGGGGGGGDPSESIEDGKSESGSWKADSGVENGIERRRVDGGEDSNCEYC